MKLFVASVAIVIATCGSTARSPFERANDAAHDGKFREAAKLYAQAGTLEAELRLANIEWRVFDDADAARTRLARLASSDKAVEAQLELARIAQKRGDFATVLAAAESALRVAKTEKDKRRATGRRARAVIEEGRDLAAVRESVAALRAVIAAEGPRLWSSRALLRAGVLIGDRAMVAEGVNGYYHVSASNPPPQLLAGAYAELSRAETPAGLAQALADLRFFDEAALVAAPDSEIARYAALLKKMESIADEHFRNIALGKRNVATLRSAFAVELKKVWPKLGFEAALERMEEQYGAHVQVPERPNDFDLHISHKISDRSLLVDQYGHKGRVRFVEVDALIANRYGSWQVDAIGAVGGWASAKGIFRVRPSVADFAGVHWMRVTDPETRAEFVKEGEADTLKGLAMRLLLQYLDRVYAETKTRDAFIARVEKDAFEYVMVLHEGRHAIDNALGEPPVLAEVEYRAKLSQVALAAAPRPSAADILADVIGGDSPHGQANEKVVRQLERWLKKNAPHIDGVKQLDRLTDNDIRAAFASLDPLAKRKR